MIEHLAKPFKRAGYETLYDAYYQELASEALVSRWEKFDMITATLTAATSSGSVVAGWAFWSSPGWKETWAAFAGAAAVAAIIHGTTRVASRIKTQEELRKGFSELRVDLESFLQNLRTRPDNSNPQSELDGLRTRLGHLAGQTHVDFGYTKRLRKNVQKHLNDILRQKGYIK